MKDILSFIIELRDARGWSEYELAKRADLPQSTVSSWYRKGVTPTFSSLDKICMAFGITLSQLVANHDDLVTLTERQKMLLDRWSRLNTDQQDIVFQLIDKM